MSNAELAALGAEVEIATAISPELVERLNKALEHLAKEDEDLVPAEPGYPGDTHAVLVLVHRLLPEWDVSINGVAKRGDGNWRCVLRSSNMRDDDAFIGSGAGPVLPHALLGALLKAAANL